MPNVLGGEGIIKTFSLPLAEDEEEKLRASALVVKEAIEALDL
jgi:malate/lactate dehydrogenase